MEWFDDYSVRDYGLNPVFAVGMLASDIMGLLESSVEQLRVEYTNTAPLLASRTFGSLYRPYCL